LPPRGFYVADEKRIYRLAPNFHARIESFELSYSVRTNAHGFRDDPVVRDPSMRSILFLGDSFTFGVGVEQRETFVEQAESFLNRDRKTRRVQCINTGVLGYGTYHERELLKEAMDLFHPEIVVLAFCLDNDFEDNLEIFHRRVEDGYLVSQNPSVDPSFVRKGLWFVGRRSHLYRFVLIRTRILLQRYHLMGGGLEPIRAAFNRNVPVDAELFQTGFQLLREIHDLCKQKNVGFMLVLIPQHYQMSEASFRASLAYFKEDAHDYERDYPNQLLRTFCRGLQVPFLDLLPVFEKADRPLFFQRRDKHFNRAGHRVAGRAIAEAIERESLGTPGHREEE